MFGWRKRGAAKGRRCEPARRRHGQVPRRPASRRLRIEPLEPLCLLTVPVALDLPIASTGEIDLAADQRDMQVGILNNGDFVIAWQHENQSDLSDTDIFLRIYQPDGTPRTDVIEVATGSNDQQDPRLGVSSQDGTIVVTWEEKGSDGDFNVFFLRFDNQGNVLPSQGGENDPTTDPVRVNSQVDGRQDNPDVSVFHDGEFVIAWQHLDVGATMAQVQYLRYEKDGRLLDEHRQGGNIRVGFVPGFADAHRTHPRVAAADTEDLFVISWNESRTENGTTVRDVMARAFFLNREVDQSPIGSNRSVLALLGGQENTIGQFEARHTADHHKAITSYHSPGGREQVAIAFTTNGTSSTSRTDSTLRADDNLFVRLFEVSATDGLINTTEDLPILLRVDDSATVMANQPALSVRRGSTSQGTNSMLLVVYEHDSPRSGVLIDSLLATYELDVTPGNRFLFNRRLHNTAPNADQDNPEIAVAENGTVIVAWDVEYESGQGQDGVFSVLQIPLPPPGPGQTVLNIVGREASSSDWWSSVNPNNNRPVTNQLWGDWTPQSWVDVRMGDFNGDGLDDFVGRVPQTGEWWVALSRSGGAGSINRFFGRWSPGVVWADVLVGDFNGDGRDDLAGRNLATGEWVVSLSGANGTATNTKVWTRWSPSVVWHDVRIGDFNGDGRADLIGRVGTSGEWWVATSTPALTGNTRYWGRWSPNVAWLDVRVGDFNGDGRADLAGRVAASGEWWVSLSGVGNAQAVNRFWTRWSPTAQWVDVRVGDFNGDGRSDIIGRVRTTGAWWVALTHASGTKAINQGWGQWSAAGTWLDVQVADVNGDGRDDIVGRSSLNGEWWIGLSSSQSSNFKNVYWGRWGLANWVDVYVGRFR